jgi:thiosulfate dehydrogenase [quinone] large subunit
MNTSTPESESKSGCGLEAYASSCAFLLLRLWLGMRAIVTGLDKFAGRVSEQKPLLDEFGQPDINGAMVAVEHKVYALKYYQGIPAALQSKFAAEPLLPAFLLKPYGALLGYALIIAGLTLVLGIATRTSLFIHGLIYVSLTFGLVLINESGGVAWLGIHLLLVVAALRLARHDRFALTKRW